MKNLYLLTTKGLGDFYVLASDPTKAQESLIKVLDYGKYGFDEDRFVTNIQWITESLEQLTTDGCKYNLSDKSARLLIVNS